MGSEMCIRDRAQLVQHSGSKPRSLGPGHELSVKAVGNMGTKTRARISQESWSTLWGLGHKCKLPGRTGRPHGHSDRSLRHPGHLVESVGPRTRARGPGTAGHPCGPMDQGPSGSVQLVDTAGPRTRTRVTRERCSTPWALGPVPESPRKTSPHLGPRSQARDSRESWSKPRARRHEGE